MVWLKAIIRHQRLTDWICENPGKICIFIILFWTFVGQTGHDPWKPDEAHTFGVTLGILKQSEWIVPLLANEPYLKHSILVYLSSALTAILTKSFFPLHDGARLSTGLWMIVVFLFTAFSAKELWGGKSTWLAPLILAGSVGLLVRGHQLTPNIIFLAGVAISIYGMAVAPRRPIVGGIGIGFGVAISSISTGLVDPWMIILFILGMMLISPLYRTKHFLISIAIAFLIALPLISIWPFFLYTTDRVLFFEWLNVYNLERMRDIFILSSKDRFFYYIGILPWFSWPAWPFAIWALWIARGQGFQRREIQLPIVTFISILFFLTVSGKGREILALPLLIPLSLLASISFKNIPRGATNAFYWFGLMVSIFIVTLCWTCYSAIELQHPRWLGDVFLKYQPFYKSNPTAQQIIAGALGTIVWIALLFNLKKFSERSAIVWTSSITIGWFLVVVLLFPWINSIKTYRYMVEDLVQHIPSNVECVYRVRIREPQRAMLDYFGNLITIPIENRFKSERCNFLLAEGEWNAERYLIDKWERIWEGGRFGDEKERYYLYRKKNNERP